MGRLVYRDLSKEGITYLPAWPALIARKIPLKISATKGATPDYIADAEGNDGRVSRAKRIASSLRDRPV